MKLTRCKLCGIKGSDRTLTSQSTCALLYSTDGSDNMAACKDRQIAKLQRALRAAKRKLLAAGWR